ncbi:MAG: hypothetical protein HC892_12335 [Saprospiraceae bacterium]|nr:hypothetical protein [Saprospiraceae bacterium]
MKNSIKITLLLSFFSTFHIFALAQTWNGIGVYELTYREGAVAIGTNQIPTSQQVGRQDLTNYKLFVCGGILADEWLVPNATWCDYVFAPDYALLPLEAVAAHIKQYGHLHNTPSAAKIETQGLPIKDITLNQQEKIEEIYLHLIQLNERLKTLEAENARLKTDNQELQAAIKAFSGSR